MCLIRRLFFRNVNARPPLRQIYCSSWFLRYGPLNHFPGLNDQTDRPRAIQLDRSSVVCRRDEAMRSMLILIKVTEDMCLPTARHY
jgi:hypothetical protein